LEPLNRYEQHLLRRQADGIEIIERAGSPQGVALLSDFFHMHIEETNTPEAFRQAGQHVAQVHLADNTRMQPGSGDIDWTAGLQALKDIGFSGYLAYECGLAGDPKEALRRSVQFVRDTIAALV
jgi:sugar phosphate isomerase/epimerase